MSLSVSSYSYIPSLGEAGNRIARSLEAFAHLEAERLQEKLAIEAAELNRTSKIIEDWEKTVTIDGLEDVERIVREHMHMVRDNAIDAFKSRKIRVKVISNARIERFDAYKGSFTICTTKWFDQDKYINGIRSLGYTVDIDEEGFLTMPF